METPTRPDSPTPEEVPQAPPLDKGAQERVEKVRRATEEWKAQLIDLGGRNTLLFYRDLKQGTLDLSEGTGVDAFGVGQLLDSKTVRLSTLFRESETRPAAAKRCRTIRAKAREMFEERGLGTLHIGVGMATWTSDRSSATPAAPVLLREARIAARGGAEEDFDLVLTGEFELNPTLLHLLATEFAIEIDAKALEDRFEEGAGTFDPRPVYSELEKSCKDIPGFAVAERVVMGNFSYAKLPMVKDLETALDALIAHDLVAAMAGDSEARDALRARYDGQVTLDDPDHTPPADEFLVLDADSSQNFAINAALHGADLVVEGPPGTGKSQTIANLIATLIARGKRVLFVAEKRAAIDAVTSRLDKVGLGDFVLDLHDGVGNKKRFAEEIARVLAQTAAIPAVIDRDGRTVEKDRRQLAEHVDALHATRPPWGVSVFEIQYRLLGIPTHLHTLTRWTAGQLEELDALALPEVNDTLDGFVSQRGARMLADPTASPWSTALEARTITSSQLAEEAGELARRLGTTTLPALLRGLASAAESTAVDPATSLENWAQVVACWLAAADLVKQFDSTVFDGDLATLVQVLKPAASNVSVRAKALVFDRGYRAARRSLKSLATARFKTSELLAGAVRAREIAADWRRLGGAIPRPTSPGNLSALSTELDQARAEVTRISTLLGRDLAADETVTILDLLQDLLDDGEILSLLPGLCTASLSLENLGLRPLIQELGARNLTGSDARTVFEHAWLSSIFEHISLIDSRVGGFRGERHSQTADEFRSADGRHIDDTSQRVRRAVAERIVEIRGQFPDESHLIQTQSKLKRKHLPVRDLFRAAPNVLTALKPCWAMSPLVVAQILPSDERYFDVVIFDEASQITPPDAIGALVRAERAVVAGDPKQLPPTAFFLSGTTDDGDGGDGASTGDFESVLDRMSALLPPPIGTRTLAWHYRSRDERLIAFSNAQQSLYDWQLTTFPGVTSGGCFEHVLVTPSHPIPGQEDSSAAEVSMVANLILLHAQERPTESLGVIAMGIKHADRITEALRRARAEGGLFDEFFQEDRDEPFFIKNLERVQGDERDAIILTVGYGKSADGRMAYRFGPLNIQGGERRLNVAITRAKQRMTVVSSFSSADMDPSRLRSEGPKMLQRYLAYAESGGADLGHVQRVKPDLNPFERDVLDRLRAAGIPLLPQFGVSGYWLDFAAQHPTVPGRMVLAIEADGAMYHSSNTARDRDRLRQEHLERLGWHFHRIWSTEWFRHRELEVERARAAYDEAVRRADSGEGPGDHLPPSSGSGAGAPMPPTRGARPFAPVGLSITDYSDRQLDAIIRWITSDTLLRTDDELIESVMGELGFQRRGNRIVERITTAVARARRHR